MGLIDDLAAVKQRAAMASERMNRAVAELARTRVRGESAGGDVKATVDGNGVLLELELAPGTAQRHPHSLGAEIVAAITAARRRAVLDSQPVLAELVGNEKAGELIGVEAKPRTVSKSSDIDTDDYFEGLDSGGILR
jgi:DNA-binding protein YbaB